MTQRHNDPHALTNEFDRMLRGIGHRGSSFTDIDRLDGPSLDRSPLALSHDRATTRLLVQEFKHEGERMKAAQEEALRAIAQKPDFTVWLVSKLDDGWLEWSDLALSETIAPERITVEEYCERYRRWWNNEPVVPLPSKLNGALTAADIGWGMR